MSTDTSLSRDEARPVAVNIAKLPGDPCCESHSVALLR